MAIFDIVPRYIYSQLWRFQVYLTVLCKLECPIYLRFHDILCYPNELFTSPRLFEINPITPTVLNTTYQYLIV